jgi:hypothetical protein
MMSILLILLVFSNLVAVGYILRTRRLIPVTIEKLRGLHEGRVATSKDLTHRLTVERDELRRKCDEYFKSIEGACNQRDFWRRWYYRQAAEHSSAQSYLLRCIEKLARQYRAATGKAARLDPVAEKLVEHFGDTHPALADAGRDANDGEGTPNPVQAVSESSTELSGS